MAETVPNVSNGPSPKGAKKRGAKRTLPIQTTYFYLKTVVKVNRAGHANNAVPRCVGHMQTNDYGATAAEVFDERDGVLHAVLHRSVQGNLRIVFQREVKEGM